MSCLYASEVVFFYNSPFGLLGTGVRVRRQNFPRTRGMRETTVRNPGVRRFVLKAGSPHASSSHFLSAPSSVRPIFSVQSTPFSYVFNVADVTDVRNSKRGYSPCNIGKCGTAMWPPSTNQIACNKSLM